MMVGHQHLKPRVIGGLNALVTGDTVVHGDEQGRATESRVLECELDNGGVRP